MTLPFQPRPDEPADSMDRVVARKPLWRRYGPLAALILAVAGVAIWMLSGIGGNVFRVQANQLTFGTVTAGPFEDYIAVRGAIAPFVIAHLTTDQGGTVKQVLVEDGAIVKKGEPLVVLSNPALQLQVASQQLQFEQTRFQISAGSARYRASDQPIEEQFGARQDPARWQRHCAQHL